MKFKHLKYIFNPKKRREVQEKRDKIVREFDIREFLKNYKTIFDIEPPGTDEDPPKDYTDDWNKISAEYREAKNWTCEDCKVNLREHKKYLHCHHKNHIRNDNRHDNLQVLCELCHAEQHSHMSPSPGDRAIIERLRREQGL